MSNDTPVHRFTATFAVDRTDAHGTVDTLTFKLSGNGPDTLSELGTHIGMEIDRFVEGLAGGGDEIVRLQKNLIALDDKNRALQAELDRLRLDAEPSPTPKRIPKKVK